MILTSATKSTNFLTRLCVGVSHLQEHRFKNSFLDTLNHICICGFDIKRLYQFYLH